MPMCTRRAGWHAKLSGLAAVIAATALSASALGQVPAPTVKPGLIVQPRPILTPTPVPVAPAQPAPLRGFVDMHAHLMSHIAFGGKFIYGGVDAGSLVPIDRKGCLYINAANESDALNQENMAHGGWGTDNGCGDNFREQVIHLFEQGLNANNPDDSTYKISGPPGFATWPAWNDLTRQRMWVEWIRRSYIGGLRVMVALATNSKLFGDLTRGSGDLPDDDMTSADMQIREIKAFAARHADFVAIAYNSGDLYNIVAANKLAIVLGIEVDQIGNFVGTATAAQLTGEVDRLYGEGVRYIFPTHITDNPIGGTAVSIDEFALVNRYENGNWWSLACAPMPGGKGPYLFNTQPGPSGVIDWLEAAVNNVQQGAIISAKLGPNWVVNFQGKPGPYPCSPAPNNVPMGNGNAMGLSPAGQEAIVQMMRHGMLIDIDHMSDRSVQMALALAEGPRGSGYPLNSGHNHIQGFFPFETANERNFTAVTYGRIGRLHGMAGVGSANLTADQWLSAYAAVVGAMQQGGATTPVAAGFGTDMNGLEFAMPPRAAAAGNPGFQINGPQYAQYAACLKGPTCRNTVVATGTKGAAPMINSCLVPCRTQFPQAYVMAGVVPPGVQYSAAFPPSTDGNKTWNYITDGVAHYGMLPDFLMDVASMQNIGGPAVVQNIMSGADYFFHTWQISEAKSAAVH